MKAAMKLKDAEIRLTGRATCPSCKREVPVVDESPGRFQLDFHSSTRPELSIADICPSARCYILLEDLR